MKHDINLNNPCEVVLTGLGAKIYNQFWAQYEKYSIVKVAAEGDTIRDHMRCLFQMFGPHIEMGFESPFKENRMLVECDS